MLAPSRRTRPAVVDTLLQSLHAWRDLGPLGLAALGLVCVFGALVAVPRPLMCTLSGLIFGFASIPVILVGSTLGAGIAFLAARHLLRERFLRLVAERRMFRAVVAAVDEEGWRLVALSRVASPLPASVQSYLFGLTGIGLRPFCAATIVGIAPQVLLYVYLGVVGQSVLRSGPDGRVQLALMVVGMVAIGVAVALVVRRTRRALSY